MRFWEAVIDSDVCAINGGGLWVRLRFCLTSHPLDDTVRLPPNSAQRVNDVCHTSHRLHVATTLDTADAGVEKNYHAFLGGIYPQVETAEQG